MKPTLPTIADIESAAAVLAGNAVETPLLESPLLNQRLGARVLVKAEMLQRTGSFKFRGAYNKISRIPAARRKAGVVAYSSGNHAQAVAAVAKLLGMSATIVMPADAPAIKRRNTEAWGAEIVSYDRHRDDREAIGTAIAGETGGTLVKPYDDPLIIAGQGTVGLELAAQLAAIEVRPDAVLVPCGGGGLIAGVSTALADRLPGVPVHAVEPAGFDSTGRSLSAGERQRCDTSRTSICDSLLAPMPGEITFAINRRTLAGGITVEDGDALAAVAAVFEYLKVVAEPGGAVGLAALLSGRYAAAGKTIAIVCSGGNVDPARFAEALAQS